MLRPQKDLLVSSHEFQLLKGGFEGMFLDLWPCRPLWQVWSKAARRRSGRSSITLGSTTQTAAYSTAAAPERDKPDRRRLMKSLFYLEGPSAVSEDERVFISRFIFSLTCFCILKFHDSPLAKGAWTLEQSWLSLSVFCPETLLSCSDVFLMLIGSRLNMKIIQMTSKLLISWNIN